MRPVTQKNTQGEDTNYRTEHKKSQNNKIKHDRKQRKTKNNKGLPTNNKKTDPNTKKSISIHTTQHLKLILLYMKYV